MLPTVSYAYNADGSTKTLGGQSLTWTPNGQLASAGTTAAPTGYISRCADGNLLVQNDTSGTTTTTTLYLPDEQFTTNGSTTSGSGTTPSPG